MTSLQTRIAQIPGRIRFFVTLGPTQTYPSDNKIQSLMVSGDDNDTQFPGTRQDGSTSGLLRDMGKSITVIDSETKQHLQLWRLVQEQVDQAGYSEGADQDPFYVKVWDHQGSDVTVARTG